MDHDHLRPDAKRLQAPAFPDDDGTTSEPVATAFAAYAADRSSYPLLLGALSESRLLVPVVAVLGEVEYDAQGLAHDKTSDMATVLLQGADGRLALLAFTGSEALRAWNPDGRPVPVRTELAARSALQDGAAALVVDVAGPVRFVVEGADLGRLAGGWSLARMGDRTVWIRPDGESSDSIQR